MPVAIAGIRVHDNVGQTWFSVYPEKQAASGIAGAGSVTIVFGGTFNDKTAGKIRGVLLQNNEAVLIDYVADVAAEHTHIFELTFNLRQADDTYKVQLIDVTPNRPASYPSVLLQTSFTFPIDNRNFVLTVDDAPLPEPYSYPDFPSLIPILSDVVNWVAKGQFPDLKLNNLGAVDFGNILGTVGKALGDTVAKPLEGLPALLTNLNALPTELSNFFGGIVGNLIKGLFETGSNLMSYRILDTLQGTPASVKSALEMVPAGFGNSFEKYVKVSNPENYLNQVSAGGDIMPAVRQQVGDCINLLREMDGINFALGLASLGQIRTVSDEIQMLEGTFGISNLTRKFNEIRQDRAITKNVEYYFNEVYQPEIPNTQDLINMVVKEKMTIDKFKDYMKKRGFNPSWSQLIWDAHFKAPDLDDILTAWRRGLITEERVDELFILIDLDPAFKQIFDTRKYQDPPLMQIRLMFETGAIDAAKVPEYIHRLGYAPEFEAAIVEFVLHFQERRYKTRYITQLMTALAQGKTTEEETRLAVADVGFTKETADIIVKTSLLRRLTYAKASETTTEKALTLGELKKAYVEDIITETELRAAMMQRGYSLTDINIVVNLLNKDKIVESEGRRVVVLTVAEMVNAWRYSVITEDTLRTNLLGRGLDLNEIDILIKTKKASWGIAESA
ncbi:hypothetical protein MUP38_08775 [Candidatus Bathyarchaeota archaeon]|nr:hypothetical protein [Candidatus Bathyarchaeota archaeon]